MANETILVIDADQETDQRIVSTLEAEGYLVFSGVSHLVTDEMADKLKPSLIYIRPLSPNAEGFKACRIIHTIPKLQNVPIVLLASLKSPLQPQHAEYYGTIDSLGLKFTSEELIAKTISVLAPVQLAAEPEPVEVEAFLPVEEAATFEETPYAEESKALNEPAAEQELPDAGKSGILNEPPAEQEEPQKESPDTRTAEEEKFPWEDEIQKPSLSRQPLPSRAYRKTRVQRPLLLPWLIGLLILVALGGAGFFVYQYFMPQELHKPVASRPERAAAPQQKEAGNAPSVPPVATAPATAPEPVAAVQTPEPPPLASPLIPITKEPSYSAQVGAFKTEEIAASLVKKLQEKGYEAYAQKGVTKDNSPVVRVLVGNFPSRKDAIKLAGEIQEKEQIKTTIFTN